MFKRALNIIFILIVMQSYAYAEKRIKVVTTIPPVAFFIENIGSEKVEIETLIPPWGNPHTYEPTHKQMNILSKADLFVKAGSGIEFELLWMKRLIALNKKMTVCDSSESIHLIDIPDNEHEGKGDEDHHNYHYKDPHIWLSPDNAVMMSQNILRAIIDIDPSSTEYYEKNFTKLVNNLLSLKKDINKRLKNIKNRQFYIFHPAWGYFARDFNLLQIPVEYSGKEPTPARMARLIKRAKQENIRVIFTSPQFSKKSAEVIANEIDGSVVFIDPMAGDYLNNLEHIAQLFLENMK
ncbi:metal ABC transporter solute-binding protein, Zn/Mn family [Thermodesulfobacteriota bacterium]